MSVALRLRVQSPPGAAPAKEAQVEGVSGDESWLHVDPVQPVALNQPETAAQLVVRMPPGAE